MANGTAAEIAQLIEKTSLSCGGDSSQFGSKKSVKNDLPGDLGFSHDFNSLAEKS
jgi:hypothetical protein